MQQQVKATSLCKHADRLKVFIGTWNMYGRLLPIDLSTFLTKNEILETTTAPSYALDKSAVHPYHLLVIGTQECERDISESLFYPSKEVWEKRLSEYLGSHYRLLKTETLAALHIAVFAWQPVAHLIKDVQSEHIKTGWANMIGNKGAVAVSVLIGSKSFIFINCHLRAHQTNVAERNANVHRILYELKMPKFKTLKHKKKKKSNPCVIDQFDHVFLFGDTNYRINAERSFVFEAVRNRNYKTLLEYDQLTEERKTEGSLLGLFQEHPIHFPPTYKLDTIIVGSSSSIPGVAKELEERQKFLTDDSCTLFNHTHPLSTYFSHHNVIVGSTHKQKKKHGRSSSTSSLPTAMATPSKLKENMKKAASYHKRVMSVTSVKRRSLSRRFMSSAPDIIPKKDEDEEGKKRNDMHQDSKIALLEFPNTILCYDSSEKQRVPSWTDRILWCDHASTDQLSKRMSLANTKSKLFSFKKSKQLLRDTTVCYAYDAVLHESLMGVSDHMPVIGVFGILFDEWTPRQKFNKILPLKKTSTIQSQHKKKLVSHKKRHWWQRLFG